MARFIEPTLPQTQHTHLREYASDAGRVVLALTLCERGLERRFGRFVVAALALDLRERELRADERKRAAEHVRHLLDRVAISIGRRDQIALVVQQLRVFES